MTRSRRRLAAGPVALPLVVLAVVALLLAAAWRVGPPPEVVAGRQGLDRPVSGVTLVCPSSGGLARATSTVAVLALPDAGTGADAPSGAQPTPIRVIPLRAATEDDAEADQPLVDDPFAGAPALEVADRGLPGSVEVAADEPRAVAVVATGALAPGLVAQQTTLASSDEVRGLADAACTPAQREHWFVGGAATVGTRGRLVLTNPGDAPAVVDVAVWDQAGPVPVPAAEDLGVPARGQRTLLLDALAAGSERLAVHVTATQGRVAAGIEVRRAEGASPKGLTWLPATAPPAREQLVPGVPPQGRRLLQVVAPGEEDAIVQVRLLGAEGTFRPAEQEVLTVSAGSVAEVVLDTAAGDAPVAVALESDVPVLAAVRVVVAGGTGAPDEAYTPAGGPLMGAGAVLALRTAAGVSSSLLVSATGDEDAVVAARPLAADGTAAEELSLDVPAGTTRALELPAGTGTVVVERSAGRPAVVRWTSGGDPAGALLDLLPVTAAVLSVRVPDVAQELSTGLSAEVDDG